MVTAFVTPTGEGEQPVQAINLHLTSYMNGRRIQRLLDFDTTEPQKCESGPRLTQLISTWPFVHSETQSKADPSRVGRLYNNQISNGSIYPIDRPLPDEKGSG